MKDTHKCVINETADHVSYQRVHSENAMKTARLGCNSTQELTERMSPNTYFTTIKHPHLLFSTSNHKCLF